jgi:hypothetical protein
VSFALGIGLFLGAAIWATALKKSPATGAKALAVAVVIGGSILLIASMMPFAYFIAMRVSARARRTGKDRRTFALKIWASSFGRLLFELAGRDMTALPPRNAAAALDQLLTEVAAAVPAGERRLVTDVRRRLDALSAETQALRAREKELDRAIAEAGPGAVADQIAAARKEIGPRIERIAAVTDDVRLKLLLVRSGVRPAADLRELIAAS